MAIQKAGESIFSAISNKAVTQIRNREEFTGRSLKTATDLAVLNQNTGWVKVSSGSNILSSNGKRTWSGPARRFILHGGATMTKDQADKLKVSTLRQGINFEKDTSFSKSGNAYNNYSTKYGLGFRPMPGITSFALSTYNPYGTLRQADVTFTVWTLEDLEEAEKLFLRPGFTCVIEFGHTVFLDNQNTLQIVGKTFNTISEDFLFSKQTIEDVEKAVENKRDESDGNYDGFFGYVSNFSYSFRPDGGYDCAMKVVSKGVILDSIKGGDTTDGAKVENQSTEDETKTIEASLPKHRSIFHTIFQSISEYYPNEDDEASFSIDFSSVLQECLENSQEIELFTKLDTQDTCKFIYANFPDPPANAADDNTKTATERLSYIPMRFVLDIFNKFASIYDISDTKRKNPIIGFALDFGNKFRTFKKHFSVSPSNVHLPKAAPSFKHPDGTEVLYGMTANGADTKMEDYAMSGNSSDDNGKNEILNIFISTKILISLADEVYNESGVQDKTFIDFINAMLKIINTSLSDVTKLSLYYNEGINKYEVVDLNGVSKIKKKLPRLTMTGLNSTVKELSISSRLSTTTAAQISIAAQGTVDTYKDNVSAIRSWNLGAVDRFVPTKTSNPNKCKDPDPNNQKRPTIDKLPYKGSVTVFLSAEENKGFAIEIKNFFKSIQDDQSFDADAEIDLQQTFRKMNLELYNAAQITKKSTDDVNNEIPIPIELSFIMKGISGLKIGQVFKIKPGVLLPKYDKYGYVITGIENKVDNNEWTTEVSTQFFETDNL